MAKAKPKKNLGGHPIVHELDEELIEYLSEIDCTQEEIARACKCSVDTLYRRYAENIKTGRARGNASLRRWQYEKAKEGNVSMLIWLGKTRLGQHEEINITATNEPDVKKLMNKIELLGRKAKEKDEERAA
jgi:hypothetical protein